MKIGEKVSAGIGEGGSGSATILDIFPISNIADTRDLPAFSL